MSRIAKIPIQVPKNVTVEFDNQCNIHVKGPKGEMSKSFANVVLLRREEDLIYIDPLNENVKFHNVMTGTVRSILASMIKGVSTLFEETLNINGVGFRAVVAGQFLNLALGKSHAIKIKIPTDIKVEAPRLNQMIIRSVSKESLGAFVDLVLRQKPADCYKGNGIYRGILKLKKRVKKG